MVLWEAYSGVGRISDLVYRSSRRSSVVQLDGNQLRPEPGQTVIPHTPGRELDALASIGAQP